MTVYFDLSFQNQTINPSVGTYSSGDGVTPSFELVDNEYYLKNVGSHGYYHFNIANIPNDVVIEFDLVFNNKNGFNWVFLFESANSNWWGIGTNYSTLELRGASLSAFTLASNITNGTKYHVTLISQYNTSGNTIKIYLNNNLVLTTVITTAYERSQFLLLGNTGNYTSNCYIKDILITDLSANTTKYLNGTGLSEVWTNTKNYISAQLLGKSDVGHTHSASDITSGLSTVATSGSYNDLSNKPIIPSKTSDLTNDSGFITSDNTKIPLAGSNQISGDLIPSTNGTVDLGSSSYRFSEGYFGNVFCGGLFGNPDSGIDINYTVGANLILRGKNRLSETGIFWLVADNGSNSSRIMGSPDGTLTWNGQPIQYASDARLKQQITQIDDDLLTAWEDVNLVQFKYNDAVEEKSDNARLHTGYVVQQIDEACKSHGVDISEYGLYCHEEYEEETEEVEVEQADGTKTKETKVIREASEHYSLRYTEALIVECAFLRKCIKELRNEIEQLKSSK